MTSGPDLGGSLVPFDNDPWFARYTADGAAPASLAPLDLAAPALRLVDPTGSVDPAGFADRLTEPAARLYRLSGGEILPGGVLRTPNGIVPLESLGWMRRGTFRTLNERAAAAAPVVKAQRVAEIAGSAAHIMTPGSTFNHFHFLGEALANLWLLEQSDPDRRIPVLINRLWFRYPHRNKGTLSRVLRSIQKATGRPVTFCDAAIARVEDLHVVNRISPTLHAVRSGFYRRLRGGKPNFFSRLILSARSPDKLYVTRAGAKVRRVVNEEALIAPLAERGFRIVRLEEHHFPAQIRMFSDARVVVAPHGAGLVNCVFMQPGTSVVEILSASNHRRGNLYRGMNVANGVEHVLFIGETANLRPNGDSDMAVDVPALLALIDGL